MKKFRIELGLFVAEGHRTVIELINAPSGSIPYRIEWVGAEAAWLDEFGGSIPGGTERSELTDRELKQVSGQKEPNRVIAIVRTADYTPDANVIRQGLVLGLEDVRDPGNLGTIIRTADWFGIRDILCSENCVELYNPKVIQSTMGSFLRVRVHYLSLHSIIHTLRETGDLTVFASGHGGENLYESKLPEKGLILLGNESRGLSPSLLELSDRVLSIPFQDEKVHAESLNVAAAAAILCTEFRRQAHAGRNQD